MADLQKPTRNVPLDHVMQEGPHGKGVDPLDKNGYTRDESYTIWIIDRWSLLIPGLTKGLSELDARYSPSSSLLLNAIASIASNPTGTLALLVGNNGMVLSYNGSTLTLLSQVTSSWLYGVTWSSSGTAYIVGNGGIELTYSNGTLTKLPSSGTPSLGGTTSSLRGIAWKPQ